MPTPRIDRFKVRLAVYLVLERNGKILMLRRANTGYQDGNYGLVQGHSDGGETVQAAVSREAKEEVDLDIPAPDVQVIHVQHSPAENEPGEEYLCVYMRGRCDGQPKNMEPDKCDDLAWFPIDALPENTIPSVKFALENIRKGEFYSNWGWK